MNSNEIPIVIPFYVAGENVLNRWRYENIFTLTDIPRNENTALAYNVIAVFIKLAELKLLVNRLRLRQ